jgi:hypothetical protein
MDYKFLSANIVSPEGKVSLKLGSIKFAKGYLKCFYHRSPKRGFFENKKFNFAANNIQRFENKLAYISTVKGKNSADYFARRCQKVGHTFSQFILNEYIEDIIHAIHLSASQRQGIVHTLRDKMKGNSK